MTIHDTIPNSRDAEIQLIGSVLLKPDVLDHSVGLRPEHFFSDDTRALFTSCDQLWMEQEPINLTSIVDRLQSSGTIEIAGGHKNIAAIISEAHQSPTAAHYEYYAGIVKDGANRRELIECLESTVRKLYDPSSDFGQVLATTDQAVGDLAQRGVSKSRVLNGRDMVQETLDHLEQVWAGDQADAITTGIVALDNQLNGGLYAGELIVIAGRTSQGKSSLAINIAGHAAINLNVPTVIVSLEMSAREVGEKLIAWHGRIDISSNAKTVRTEAVAAAAVIAQAPITTDDTPGRTVSEIAALGRALKRQGQVGMLIVDYVQLLTAENNKLPRNEQVAEQTRRLKQLARELQVPVIVLAQLNREADKSPRPTLSHLRESGSIEQDANKVILVHRPDSNGKATLIVAKHRNGPTGDVDVSWHGSQTRFADLAPRHMENYVSDFGDFNNGG